MAFISQIKLSNTTYDISAIKLKNARTISLTGSITGSGLFDGSGNLSIATITNHNHDDLYTKRQAWQTTAGGSYVGWIKLIEWTPSTAGNFTLRPTLFSLYRSYNSPQPECYLLSLSVSWDSTASINLLQGIGTRTIKNFRFTRNADKTKYWFEMYVDEAYTTYANTCYCSIFGYESFTGTLLSNTLQTETVTSLKSIQTVNNGIVADNFHGNASTATKLQTARTIQTNLASTSTASFDGTANITPGVTGILPINNGGTGANNRKTAITNLGVFGLYSREDIGIAPNFDNPGVNGLFEMRSKAETTGETGSKPFDGYAPFISLRYSNTMFQLAGTNDSGFYVRGKQGTDPTLTNTAWQKFLTNANWSDYCAAKSHTHSYLPLSGGTMTGQIKKNTASSWVGGRDTAIIRSIDSDSGSFHVLASAKTPSGSWEIGSLGENFRFSYVTDTNYNAGTNKSVTSVYVTNGGVLMGAAWNDYAEYRICNEEFKPGQVVLENGDDTLSIASQRLQRGCSIVSDTFGFAIGETDEAKCPIAVSGRVLAYGYESREEFKKHIGWPVCSGPNGTVSIMTEEEEEKYPSRIIGTISAVPEYETWGTGNVEVNNRIWIKIK